MNEIHYHLDGYIAHSGKECRFCKKQVNRYTITWTMEYDAESPKDALLQAVSALDDVVNRKLGATVFIVTDTNTHEITVMDYENLEVMLEETQ